MDRAKAPGRVTIRAGTLNKRIRLERRSSDRDAVGQVVDQWSLVQPNGEVWARVEPLGGRTEFGAQQWVSVGDVKFTIRIREDISPLDRVIYAGRVYDIASVAPDVDALYIVGRARAEGPSDA